MTTIVDSDAETVCRWCGMSTPIAVTCASCGSPMDGIVRCRYCRNVSAQGSCGSCQEVLIRLWRIAQESPESRFLFADVL